MTPRADRPSLGSAPVPAGLRLRIWVGCLAGSAVATLGLIWVVGTLAPYDGSADPVLIAVFPWAVGGLGMLTGITMAMWLDHNIVGHLRGLSRALAGEQVAELRGLPAASEWGELSELTQSVQRLITRMERTGREAIDARRDRERLEETIESIMDALGRWASGEAPPLEPGEGPLAALAEALGRRAVLERRERDRSRDAVLEIRAGVRRGLEEAHETESQAERGFVEATALLTTVRELQRLRGELEGVLLAAGAGSAGEPALEAFERYRAAAAGVIEELVSASTESVDRLASGLTHVQEIADHVHTLANRATLVALDAALGAGSEARLPPRGDRAAELRGLAGEVQSVMMRTAELSREVDDEVAAAIGRMRGLRERVSEQLEAAPQVLVEAPPQHLAQAGRLLDRVREMVHDAMQKGERLSATGERASTAAQRLVRRLEEEIPAIEALIARLSAATAAEGPAGRAAIAGGLRQLTSEDLATEEPPVSGTGEAS
ncbi:MAG TPA: hypothetical protein VI792_12090 [Candidatus Eisenbacteria bacterium]